LKKPPFRFRSRTVPWVPTFCNLSSRKKKKKERGGEEKGGEKKGVPPKPRDFHNKNIGEGKKKKGKKRGKNGLSYLQGKNRP